mmetsp:Transcript_6782/g.10512  ORF Transcript_6782/g.10512 Transcript_6782/m.10512 type:complete len:202 (-) Transcript_6782:2475-3080(-)
MAHLTTGSHKKACSLEPSNAAVAAFATLMHICAPCAAISAWRDICSVSRTFLGTPSFSFVPIAFFFSKLSFSSVLLGFEFCLVFPRGSSDVSGDSCGNFSSAFGSSSSASGSPSSAFRSFSSASGSFLSALGIVSCSASFSALSSCLSSLAVPFDVLTLVSPSAGGFGLGFGFGMLELGLAGYGLAFVDELGSSGFCFEFW